VSKQVELIFPGVAEQFRKDAEAHYERHGIKPMFGLFWNFYLNNYFWGQERVHCWPYHTGWKFQNFLLNPQ
jgi:hypothetical protein